MKTILLRCANPRDRAEVSRRIRNHCEAQGITCHVEPRGAFKLRITAEPKVLEDLFDTKPG
jgi:hypothetical protein